MVRCRVLANGQSESAYGRNRTWTATGEGSSQAVLVINSSVAVHGPIVDARTIQPGSGFLEGLLVLPNSNHEQHGNVAFVV